MTVTKDFTLMLGGEGHFNCTVIKVCNLVRLGWMGPVSPDKLIKTHYLGFREQSVQ